MLFSLYIDPSATTILISSIGGVVIAVGAAFAIWWRKVKKKVAKTFHIDENANKEVEEELVINDEEVSTAEAATANETAAENAAQTSDDGSDGAADDKE